MPDEEMRLLDDCVNRFREAIFSCLREGDGLPIQFLRFPEGACGDASWLLSKYLGSLGIRGIRYITARRGGETHAWLELGDYIVDVTRDQYESGINTFVSLRGGCSLYNFFITTGNFEGDYSTRYDATTVSQLNSAYRAIEMRLAT